MKQWSGKHTWCLFKIDDPNSMSSHFYYFNKSLICVFQCEFNAVSIWKGFLWRVFAKGWDFQCNSSNWLDKSPSGTSLPRQDFKLLANWSSSSRCDISYVRFIFTVHTICMWHVLHNNSNNVFMLPQMKVCLSTSGSHIPAGNRHWGLFHRHQVLQYHFSPVRNKNLSYRNTKRKKKFQKFWKCKHGHVIRDDKWRGKGLLTA